MLWCETVSKFSCILQFTMVNLTVFVRAKYHTYDRWMKQLFVIVLQAFLLPSCEASATRKVIRVYRKWFLQEKPAFMYEPETSSREEDGEEEHLVSETDNAHIQVRLRTDTVHAKTLKCVYSPVHHQSSRLSRLTGINDRPAGGALTRSAAPSAEAVWLKNRTTTWRPAFSPPCRCADKRTQAHINHAGTHTWAYPLEQTHTSPYNSQNCRSSMSSCDPCVGIQVFLTNSANVFLLEPCQDVPKLLENQLEVCKGVLSVYRHIIMEQNMNRQTWSAPFHAHALLLILYSAPWLMALWVMFREQLLQVLLRITEAVMKRPQESQRKDVFAHSLASILFKVSHFIFC